MRCPSCDRLPYSPNAPCSNCHFSGDSDLIEELGHIDWLLSEVDTWQTLDDTAQQHIRQTYTARQRELEIKLGLRLPPFTAAEAQTAWPQLFQRETLLQKIDEWLKADLLLPAPTQVLAEQIEDQVYDFREQLEGHNPPVYPQNDADRLATVNFLLEAVAHLSQTQSFATPEAQELVLTQLLDEQEQLEIKLGYRAAPAPAATIPEHETRPEPTADTAQVPAVALDLPASASSSSPVSPAPPLSERLWRTLLSERTLHALLFLGIFLLFAAALSFVVWGWKDFSAPLRVAIPTGFTAIFFTLGWYVRAKTTLYRSGIALSAVAALLIPIDFYTVYVNFNIPTAYWPSFWLITSFFCVLAYTLVTFIIRSRFFGYLTGAAAGSVALALIEVSHQLFGLSLDWRTTGLSGLALGLIVLATVLEKRYASTSLAHAPSEAEMKVEDEPSPHLPGFSIRIFAEPFRYLALLTMGVLLPLTFGWRFIGRETYDTLHYALTVNWWLGGFIFGWGAVHYRSHSLGLLAVISLPIATYLAQAALFHQAGISPAWHALGWALLVPLYLVVGYKLLTYKEDPILYGHGRMTTGWGLALLVIATLWALIDLTNGAAAASSHTVLAGAVMLAALLWRRPAYLYLTSLFSLSAVTFAMATLEINLAHLAVGWVSLALVHLIAAINIRPRLPGFLVGLFDLEKGNSGELDHSFIRPLVIAGYGIAVLALLPPFFFYNSRLLAYVLGNWLGMAAWGAYLAHTGQPNFVTQRKSIFHWFTAVPLPVWIWLLFINRRPPDFSLAVALAVLAWGLVSLSYRLNQVKPAYGRPWYITGLLVSLLAAIAAFFIDPNGFAPAVTLLITGLLYLADGVTKRQVWGLAAGGQVAAWGYLFLLNRLHLPAEIVGFALALLIAVYFLAGLATERRKSPIFTRHFLTPLYLNAHILSLILLLQIYLRPVINFTVGGLPWTDEMQLWGAASQILLGFVYGLYAWGVYKERWGHVAVWLGVAGSSLVALVYSQGQGSLAGTGALGAIMLVLIERSLHQACREGWPNLKKRQQAFLRLTWRLFKRPLLVAGWTISAGVIGLALIRNLWLLGGGRPQQIWAAVGLLLITGLYALSARLFRQKRFVWLAAFLIFAPWTILTNLGWFTVYRPTLSGFALSWIILAWGLFLTGLIVRRWAGPGYALPLNLVAHLLLPFSLLWGFTSVDTSRFTFALAIGLYGLAAWLDHRSWPPVSDKISPLGKTKFLYPALGLIPIWCLYLMAWLLPSAQVEHYGLLLLLFGPLGLIAGQWLSRVAPKPKVALDYALPGYLPGYFSVIAGTLLVIPETPLLALVLLFDALLMLASARLFRNPVWVYLAAIITPVSLLLALAEAGIESSRHGWWLIGLASIYLLLAWALRRVKLPAYGQAALAVGLTLIALGLPPSSQDRTGAWWGYGSAALLYTITAFWLRRPVWLTLASGLIIVPYGISLQESALKPEYYGLALFPGAIIALSLGWWLDHFFGSWRDFPWGELERWSQAFLDRLVGWWGLPLYGLGFGLAAASPFLTEAQADLSALNFLLLMPLFGWAIYRFRLRVWLLATALAGHLAAVYYLESLGWWRYPALAWYRFLPVTAVTILIALFIEWRRQEGSPWLESPSLLKGWSHILYIIGLLDIIVGQLFNLGGTTSSAVVSLTHALLIGLLASFWLLSWLPYLSITLGTVALVQWLATLGGSIEGLPVALAGLALGYGLTGYGLTLFRRRLVVGAQLAAHVPTPSPSGIWKPLFLNLAKDQDLRPQLTLWELPLQRFSLVFSVGILVLTLYLGVDLISWTVRALFGLSFRQIVDLATVTMAVRVLALLGLLYIAAAFIQRWLRLWYAAVGMLLASWALQAFYVQQWDNIQWYAIPAGLYLSGIAYLEWQQGNKVLARWLDYAAMLLMLGSLFWQTLLFGWGYALLLGGEGFAAFWWGSARRLRRFFYGGMVGVMLATVGQLLNSLRSINQWIVFGIIGLLLVILAILIERKLDRIKAWQEVLESWE